MNSVPAKILVVDDDRDFADATAEFLEISGYPVDVCFTAKAGTEAVKKNRYDVVLLDVGLPDRSGCDAWAEMRRIDPNLQCYLLTGYRTEQLPESCTDSDAIEIMTKPIEMEELVKRFAAVASAES